MMRMKMGRTAKWHSGEFKSPTAYVGCKISRCPSYEDLMSCLLLCCDDRRSLNRTWTGLQKSPDQKHNGTETHQKTQDGNLQSQRSQLTQGNPWLALFV